MDLAADQLTPEIRIHLAQKTYRQCLLLVQWSQQLQKSQIFVFVVLILICLVIM
jgi:hypothetical protein